jgi:tRNA(fMet)-specific endonuclease VapC
MPRFLLDTNVLSEPLRPRPSRRVLRRLEKYASQCATAAPVLHELRYGSHLLTPSRRREAIERYLNEVVLRVYEVLPYNLAAAEWHAAERARLAKLGKPVPYFDGLVASIAKTNDLILVTANVRDFQRFQQLQVEDWRRKAAEAHAAD